MAKKAIKPNACQVLAIVNNKGGCGKTCTAQNLAAFLRLEGFSVLAVDLDGQGNLTAAFGAAQAPDLYEAFMKDTTPAAVEVRPAEGKTGKIDIIPSCRDMGALNVDLATKGRASVAHLRRILEPMRSRYDFIVIDTPPASDLLSMSALYCSDAAIVCARPQAFDLQGVFAVRDNIEALQDARGSALPFRVLITQYDKRRSFHRAAAEAMKSAELPTFAQTIRDSTTVGEANAASLDIFEYSPRSNAAQDYKAAAREALEWFNKL